MKKIITNVFFVSLFLIGCSPPVDESKAIQQLLEKESATWRSGDVKGHADCWHIQPYSKILISTGDSTGMVLDISPDVIVNPSPGIMAGGGTSKNSNYKMSIHGDNAWVSHDEESTAKDGKTTYSHEIRILEKIAGQWKLVGQSIHTYKPK